MPIRKRYKVRPGWTGAKGTGGKEVTLPKEWCDYHNIELGQEITMLADGIVVILPPGMEREKEEEVRRFLEAGSKK